MKNKTRKTYSLSFVDGYNQHCELEFKNWKELYKEYKTLGFMTRPYADAFITTTEWYGRYGLGEYKTFSKTQLKDRKLHKNDVKLYRRDIKCQRKKHTKKY